MLPTKTLSQEDHGTFLALLSIIGHFSLCINLEASIWDLTLSARFYFRDRQSNFQMSAGLLSNGCRKGPLVLLLVNSGHGRLRLSYEQRFDLIADGAEDTGATWMNKVASKTRLHFVFITSVFNTSAQSPIHWFHTHPNLLVLKNSVFFFRFVRCKKNLFEFICYQKCWLDAIALVW